MLFGRLQSIVFDLNQNRLPTYEIDFIWVFVIFTLYFLISEGMYQYPRWPGRSPDRQCMLGVVLSGARNPAWRTDAVRQDDWGRGRLLQHVLQRDRGGKTCPPGRVRWSGTHRCRLVDSLGYHVGKGGFTAVTTLTKYRVKIMAIARQKQQKQHVNEEINK